MRSRRFLLVPALVAGALVAQAGLASPAHAAIVRYAVPGGNGANSCTSPATACSIDKAINQAAAGDEVIVASGSYNLGDRPASATARPGSTCTVRPASRGR